MGKTWFSAPICHQCYTAHFRKCDPVRIVAAIPEVCCRCGCETREGIYVREHRDNIHPVALASLDGVPTN